MCSIGDPHNLGSIIRSSYFCGVDKVFTTDNIFEGLSSEPFLKSTAPLSPVVSKSSCGVLEIFQPVHIKDPIQFISTLQREGCSIIGSGTKNAFLNNDKVHNHDKNIKTPCTKSVKSQLLVIGNEGFGIPKNISNLCDEWIYLQPGRELDSDVDSLNVSVATALLINSMKSLNTYSSMQ